MPRRNATGSICRTSRPLTAMRPSLGSISRLIIFSVVVLPQPDPPSSTSNRPSGTRKLTSRTQ
jgi:hypothetical protein